jgi:hypothetical protein
MYAARTRAAVGVAVALGGLTMAGATAPAQAQEVGGCHAADLAIGKGRLDAGASQRYQDIRIRNVSDAACRLTGYPAFTWKSNGDTIGWGSTPAEGTSPRTVVLQPGAVAWTTLHWVDPGPVPKAQCAAKETTGVLMTLPARPHAYRIVLDARVCTTKLYRPDAYPVRATKAV